MITYADQISTQLLYGKYYKFFIVPEIMCWPKYELKNHSMVSARVLRSMAHGLPRGPNVIATMIICAARRSGKVLYWAVLSLSFRPIANLYIRLLIDYIESSQLSEAQ